MHQRPALDALQRPLPSHLRDQHGRVVAGTLGAAHAAWGRAARSGWVVRVHGVQLACKQLGGMLV